jgi:DNA-binding transcriptional LysR family regulator
LNEKFAENGIKLKPQIEFAVHDLLLRFASINFGVSCVVEEFSKESIENGVVRKMPVEPVLPARSVGCAYLKHNPLSLAAQAFLELIREENIK